MTQYKARFDFRFNKPIHIYPVHNQDTLWCRPYTKRNRAKKAGEDVFRLFGDDTSATSNGGRCRIRVEIVDIQSTATSGNFYIL